MEPKYLVIMDVSQKQRYIFGSNRLRENIGASMVIARMTKTVPMEAYQWYRTHTSDKKNSETEELFTKLPTYESIKEYIDEHLAYDGGGKSVYRFPTETEAKQFIKIVSNYALRTYFGIELFFAMQQIETDNKLKDIQNLYKKLEEKKSFRLQSFRLYGIGLNEKCPSTSLPVHIVKENMGLMPNVVEAAQDYEDNLTRAMKQGNVKGKVDTYGKEGFNLEVYTKLAVLNEESDENEHIKQKSFQDFLPTSQDCSFPLDLENLGGTKDEKNKIAIVAIDGNGMGKRIQSIQEFIKRNPTMDYLICLTQFSNYITKVYKKSVERAVDQVNTRWTDLSTSLDLKIDQKTRKRYLPIRPLIAAGDDLCFITEGRIGLSFAKLVLNTINTVSKEELQNLKSEEQWIKNVVLPAEGMFASAGVVICGVKYPFSRAYDLAEELLKAGKAKLAREESIKGDDASMIDFHVAMGEIEENLIAEREKGIIGDTQTAKPFILSQEELPFSYRRFEKAMGYLKKLTEDQGQGQMASKVGKSQLKELAYYIRKGKDYAANYVNQSNRLDEKELQSIIGEQKDYSILLDAIEMLDLYVEIGDDKK